MSENVVGFTGTLVRRVPGSKCERVIAELERLLEDAKSGELTGIAYATSRQDGQTGSGWTVEDGTDTKYPLAAAISMLNHRYSESLVMSIVRG